MLIVSLPIAFEAVVFAERCSEHVSEFILDMDKIGDVPDWRAEGLSELIEHAS